MEAKKSVLIDNIENVSIRFLDQKNEWQQQWPSLSASSPIPGTTTATTVSESPLAIEIILKLKDWGDIRRLYFIK